MRVNPLLLIQRLYTLLLGLYPANFRQEFSGEMAQVFQEASHQAQQIGLRRLMAFLLKELFDLPGSLLSEHAWVLFRKEAHMSEVVNLDSNAGGLSASLGFSSPPVSWKESLLAALPFLAIAFSGLTTLLSGLGFSSSESPLLRILTTVFTLAFLVAALGILIFAWRKHWPRWSAGWYIFWLFAALAPLGLLSNFWDLPNAFYVFVQPFLWAFILLVIAWLLYHLSCQDAVKGILAALPVMGMTWILHQEFVRDDLEGTITLACWLLVAVSAVLILRFNTLRAGVLLALGTNILIGLAYAYEGIYYGGTLNSDAPGSNWIQVLRSFLPQWVAVSTLVLGPLLARFIREIGYRIQPAGLWMYRLVLSGLLLLIVCNVTASMIYTTDDLRISLHGKELVLNTMTWIGLAVFVIGFILFSRKALHDKAIKSPWILLLLGLCSCFVPFALLMGLLAGFRLSLPFFWYPAWSMLRGVSPIQQFPEFWPVALGVLWVVAASWLVIYINSRMVASPWPTPTHRVAKP
jgi:hypothetical protein